ncbi:uncharacterized protein DNG_08747 [Cephalotrichum gorgonifer]|uniref:Uncharacterized protein n=1 Tax=Cephalotrichum gorgonifer TaxID=2041049 RepID=A0AAE8SYU1_9PEZI|nr:uncharacterized protein DNG_08747 [Cephalotrichum gorgonifer]
MIFLLTALAALPSYAQFVRDDSGLEDAAGLAITGTIRAVNGTVEHTSFCRTCPYNICTHTITMGADTYQLTCWASGDLVGDTKVWLKTAEGCFVPEYDLVEYEGDYVAELEFCGDTPLVVTHEPAIVRYLSECKWGYSTSRESIKYYGRDADITVTCWAEGEAIMNDHYWYKTLDYCWVSGSGLWNTPDRDNLQWCGPDFGYRLNESDLPLDTGGAKPTDIWNDEDDEDEDEDDDEGLARRWLQPEQIGEEYAGCYTCPSSVTNETCHLETVYEFNQTVVSQCVTRDANSSTQWMYTTDWCYVNSTDFWVPPYDNYRYPRCEYFELGV